MWNNTYEKKTFKLRENQLIMKDIMMYKLYKCRKKRTICSSGINNGALQARRV